MHSLIVFAKMLRCVLFISFFTPHSRCHSNAAHIHTRTDSCEHAKREWEYYSVLHPLALSIFIPISHLNYFRRVYSQTSLMLVNSVIGRWRRAIDRWWSSLLLYVFWVRVRNWIQCTMDVTRIIGFLSSIFYPYFSPKSNRSLFWMLVCVYLWALCAHAHMHKHIKFSIVLANRNAMRIAQSVRCEDLTLKDILFGVAFWLCALFCIDLVCSRLFGVFN